MQRTIVRRLFESRGLAESEFQSGGSTYKCAFGKYYKDGEEISRDDYFKAKQAGLSSSPAKEDKPKVDAAYEESIGKIASSYGMAGTDIDPEGEPHLDAITKSLGSDLKDLYCFSTDMIDGEEEESLVNDILDNGQVTDTFKDEEWGREYQKVSHNNKDFVVCYEEWGPPVIYGSKSASKQEPKRSGGSEYAEGDKVKVMDEFGGSYSAEVVGPIEAADVNPEEWSRSNVREFNPEGTGYYRIKYPSGQYGVTTSSFMKPKKSKSK